MNAQVKTTNTFLDSVKWVLAVALIVAAVGGNYYFSAESLIYRVIGVLVLLALAVVVGLATTKGKAVNRLRKEAWVEVSKVVWPTRQETIQTTLVVIAFVLVVALILWAVDALLGLAVSSVLG